MPAPSDYSTLAGVIEVWARISAGDHNPAGGYQFQPDWDCVNVQIGTSDRVSTAVLKFNRDKVINPPVGFVEKFVYDDAIFLVRYQPPNAGIPTVLFEGSPATLPRQISGSPGNSFDTGELHLQSSMVMWSDALLSQIYGRFVPRVPDGQTNGTIINDPSLPCIFNPNGRPNRSVKTAKDTLHNGTSIFDSSNRLDSHYFTADDGWDFHSDGGTIGARKARYWTYAQAIAYVLHRYCYNPGNPMGSTSRNFVSAWFGVPIEQTATIPPADRRYPDSDTLWGAIIGPNRSAPIFKVEAYGERYEGDTTPLPTSVAFDPTPARLLTAKINDLSIEGMNVMEALGVLFRAAGMGIWVDSFMRATGLPLTIEQVIRTWTPGGTLADPAGIGAILLPKLEPHGTPATSGGVARTAADIFAKNTVEVLEKNSDYSRIVNAPIILRAPTIIEITAQLRPGWRPLHDRQFGYFDNVDPAVTVNDNGVIGSPNELEVAIADSMRAMAAWSNNPEDLFTSAPTDPMVRIKALAKRLCAKGEYGSEFYDIGRKWIIPTDLSYPSNIYSRASITGIPWFWKTYRPADFSQISDGQGGEDWLTEAIPSASSWPTRRMEFVPCLTQDASGKSIGMRVEVSFDRGDTWHPYTSFRVLPDELGIYLTYENPFDVQNPSVTPQALAGLQWKTRGNLWMAYLHHNFRVRITAGILAPDPTAVIAATPHTVTAARCRVYDRRNKYGKTDMRSRFKTRVTDDLKNLAAFNATAIDPDKKLLYYKARDDSVAMLTENNRTQAALGEPTQSGMFITPWIETDHRPGMIVPYLDESTGGAALTRRIDFRTTAGGKTVAPHVAGMIYNFARGGFRTTYLLDDWRSMSEEMRG